MSRRHMPGAMPADIAEMLSDVRPLSISAAMKVQAREEMIERLLEGKPVDRVTFAALLDGELDSGVIDHDDIAGHMCSIIDFGRDDLVHGERRANLRLWMQGIVERWVDAHPEKILERAEEIAEADAEDEGS